MDSYDRNESEQSMHFENQIDFSTYSEHVVCCSTRSCNIWTTVHFPITEFISITSSNFMCGFCQARINCSRPMCISNYTQTSFTTESCCDSSIKMDSTRNSNCSEMQTRTSDLQTTNVSILKTESSSLEKLFPGEKDSSARKRRSRRGSRMLKSADDSPMRASTTSIERKRRRKFQLSPCHRQGSLKLQHNETPSPFHLFERIPDSGKLPSPKSYSSASFLPTNCDVYSDGMGDEFRNFCQNALEIQSSVSDDNDTMTYSSRSNSKHQHQSVQTHFTLANFQDFDHESTYEQTKELVKEKEDLSKAVLDLKAHLIGANSRINRCSEIIKTLLIEKSEIETTNAKRKCNEDKLRLGQYIMQRQGATFVEQWVDGYAIEKLLKQQSSMNKAKEEIERERKGLLKRKPILKCNSTTAGNASTMVNKSTTQPQASDPESSNDKFYDKPLSAQEWHEREEVLRIRLAALRKEEIELQLDLEKLGRERHLHIREIKRIDHQKNSRFHNGCMLNDRYLLLSMLGRGGFSEVHKAFDCREQHYVACKVHQLNREWSDEKKANYIKHAIREYNIHKSLDHPRIVRLYDVFEIDNNSFCTVLEYCEGNDLDFVLKQSKNFPEKESRSIIMQIISGLRYLNIFVKPPVIHYDLKPGNIMVGTGSRSGEIKITDFGLSKQMDEDCYDPEHGMDLTSQGAGTYWYLPPEVFVQGPDPPKISSKVDVWSLGCMFFQCLYGRKPFGHNLSQSAILENNTILKAKEVQFPTKPPISNEAKAFIRKCLTYKVKNRPDIIQLSEDEYVQGFFRRGTSSSASSSAAALTYQQSGISSSATSSHSCKPANTLLPSQQPCQQTPE